MIINVHGFEWPPAKPKIDSYDIPEVATLSPAVLLWDGWQKANLEYEQTIEKMKHIDLFNYLYMSDVEPARERE